VTGAAAVPTEAPKTDEAASKHAADRVEEDLAGNEMLHAAPEGHSPAWTDTDDETDEESGGEIDAKADYEADGETEGEADDTADEEASDAEMAALAVELLSETVRLMGFEAEVVASWQEPDADNDDQYLLLDLHGRDLGALIGRRGETLGNLQYLLRLMVNQRLHQWKNIVVDVEQYRQHRAEHLMQLALRSAEQVAKTGRPLSLEPMPPNERRIVHLALRDHALVYTESSGEGERRKIQILPRRS
jgi:spoIIIJ-associated protein